MQRKYQTSNHIKPENMAEIFYKNKEILLSSDF